MIETIVLDFLAQELDYPVYMETPEKPPKKYVLIEKTSGSEKDHVCSSTLAVQSLADSLYQAAELNEQVKSAMRIVVDNTEISKCSLNTDYNFTDTTTKKYRYQAVFELVHF